MKTNINFNDDTLVEIRVMNKVAEIKHTSFINRNIERVNGKNIDVDSGEIVETKYDDFETFPVDYSLNNSSSRTIYDDVYDDDDDVESEVVQIVKDKKTRLANPKALSYTRKHTKNIIISSYEGVDKFSFITLLYDNVDLQTQSIDEVKLNMTALLRRIKRNYTTDDNRFKYLYTIEKNYAGYFHVHLLLYWDSFVPQSFLDDKSKLWKYGYLYYSAPLADDCEITYLAAYLTYGTCNSSEFINKFIIPETREEKKAVKHSRLDCFSEYKRIFFHSNNMPETKPVVMTYAEAKKKFGFSDDTVFYSNTFTKNISTETTIHQEYEYHCVS